MSKIKIRIISVGHLPADLNLERIKNWKSKVFEVVDGIENYGLICFDLSIFNFSISVLSTLCPRAQSSLI